MENVGNCLSILMLAFSSALPDVICNSLGILDEVALPDVYEVWYHPWWHTTKFYLFLVFCLCVVLMGVFKILKKYFRRVKKISYRQSALQDLYRLESQTYVSDQVVHEAYFKVTMILKRYLSKKFDVQLLNKSDKDVVEQIQAYVSIPMGELLMEFFDRSFQIKFAYDSVSEQMLRDDIAFVQKVIHDTSSDLDEMEKN